MIIAVFVDTEEAEEGYDDDERPSFNEHVDNISELLRSGYYVVAFADEARDGEREDD